MCSTHVHMYNTQVAHMYTILMYNRHCTYVKYTYYTYLLHMVQCTFHIAHMYTTHVVLTCSCCRVRLIILKNKMCVQKVFSLEWIIHTGWIKTSLSQIKLHMCLKKALIKFTRLKLYPNMIKMRI